MLSIVTTSDETPDPDEIQDEEITGELEPIGESQPSTEPTTTPQSLTTQSRGLARLVAKGVLAAAVLFVLGANPNNSLKVQDIAAFVLIVFGSIELLGVVRLKQTYGRYIQPVAAIAAGTTIFVWPNETLYIVGVLLGALVVLRGTVDVWSAIRRWHEHGANTWVFVRGLILVALGVLVLLVPSSAVTVAVVGGSILLISRAIIGVWFALASTDAAPEIQPTDTYAVMTYTLSRRELSADQIEHIENNLFLHRGDAKGRIARFFIFMLLATAIATFGIASDSTAVVIGAMLLAPLMTPILGVSAGLINGRSRSAGIAAAVVVAGSVASVALAWALSAIIPDLAAVIANGQVTSRTAPSLLDLAIAIAAGAAGAYGVSRAETSDALPGVAVAIALVPPLAVIGVTLYAGDFTQAAGATLLFLTNLFSIVLMAGIVFLLVGYGSWSRLHYRRNRIRTSFAIVVLAVIIISMPLALTAQRLVGAANDERNASDAVNTWLEEEFPDDIEMPLHISNIEVDDDTVTVHLVGWEEPPTSARLSEIVSESIGRPMAASVRWIEERIELSS